MAVGGTRDLTGLDFGSEFGCHPAGATAVSAGGASAIAISRSSRGRAKSRILVDSSMSDWTLMARSCQKSEMNWRKNIQWTLNCHQNERQPCRHQKGGQEYWQSWKFCLV